MKITKLMRFALFAAVLAVLAITGCEKADIYSIDAPSDLQNRIDSIADAKANMNTGDTTYIDIVTALVGPEDNSAGWWAFFSDYFTIPANKLLHLEFVNHGSGANFWNNWNLCLASAERDADGYAEYFVLRSDAFGWGNVDFDLAMVSNNFTDIFPEILDGDWSGWISAMNGAYVTLEVDHSVTGNAFITATAAGTDGSELVVTYQQPVSAVDDLVAFLICDGSYFEMKKAYLLPSKMTVVEDVNPVSISITGTPEFIEIGDEDFWGDAVATVTFADGSSAQVDTADISFNVIPDMTTLGEKTVIAAYNKTKQGEYSEAVSTYYTFEITNSVASIAVTTMPNITEYYYFGTDPVIFNADGLVVTATYSDGTTSVLGNETLQFGTITAAEGAQTAEISYVGATSTVTTTVPLNLVQGSSQVGANDFSTGFWGAHSADYPVASGSSTTIKMYCYSQNISNWHSPATILRKADMTEYAVVRMDNFGWGSGYDNNPNLVLSSDWNWDIFGANVNGSYIEITVTNNGDGTANIRYDVTYNSGETHFQQYEGVVVDSSDLNVALTVDNCYLVIVE